jgi:hypothetical protein
MVGPQGVKKFGSSLFPVGKGEGRGKNMELMNS